MWRLVEETSPLLGHASPGLNLQALVVAPGAAERLAKEHWQRGNLQALTLSGDRQDLIWYMFWNLA